MRVNLYAKCIHKDWGYDHDQEKCKELNDNEFYKVESVDMGQSHTSIRLIGYHLSYNSVNFDFYELTTEGQYLPFDIYSSAEFNPYIRRNKRRSDNG